jgi:hypothetical protein
MLPPFPGRNYGNIPNPRNGDNRLAHIAGHKLPHDGAGCGTAAATFDM